MAFLFILLAARLTTISLSWRVRIDVRSLVTNGWLAFQVEPCVNVFISVGFRVFVKNRRWTICIRALPIY